MKENQCNCDCSKEPKKKETGLSMNIGVTVNKEELENLKGTIKELENHVTGIEKTIEKISKSSVGINIEAGNTKIKHERQRRPFRYICNGLSKEIKLVPPPISAWGDDGIECLPPISITGEELSERLKELNKKMIEEYSILNLEPINIMIHVDGMNIGKIMAAHKAKEAQRAKEDIDMFVIKEFKDDVLYECYDCHTFSVMKAGISDGYMCPKCGTGRILPVQNGIHQQVKE